MRVRYIVGVVEAKNQTDKAFCCSLNWTDQGYEYVARDLWVPLSQIHPEYHDEIDEACAGDMIEIAISQWFLDKTF